MKVFNRNFSIDLTKTIIWQYDKAEKLVSLITSKQTWYNNKVAKFIEDFFNNFININTANDYGLNLWGKILNFDRNIKYATGVVHYCSTEEYRFLLKAQILRFKCNGTVPEINEFLYKLFDDKNHQCYVIDNYNMTMNYVLQKDFSDKQWLIDWLTDPVQTYLDWLPRPAGVQIVIETGYSGFMGFEGSELETFDNGILLN